MTDLYFLYSRRFLINSSRGSTSSPFSFISGRGKSIRDFIFINVAAKRIKSLAEARRRFEAGLDAEAAALDIAMDRYDDWLDRERIVINVLSLYREYGAPPGPSQRIDLHAMMARYRRARG
jgi:hypothetical protein